MPASYRLPEQYQPELSAVPLPTGQPVRGCPPGQPEQRGDLPVLQAQSALRPQRVPQPVQRRQAHPQKEAPLHTEVPLLEEAPARTEVPVLAGVQ